MNPYLGPIKALDSRRADLRRILTILTSARAAIARADLQVLCVSHRNGDPVTGLDREINRLIQCNLPFQNEGWLSEESHDDLQRLQYQRVWMVDPIDGTRELVEGIPEWCVSVGLVEKSRVVAGGILNPCTGEMFLGSLETGLKTLHLAGLQTRPRTGERKKSCTIRSYERVVVSRKEYREGKWDSFESGRMKIIPVGSVAFRLALVAAGCAEATCTFGPRNEWDIAAGAALVQASGGTLQTLSGKPILFNNRVPRLERFCAFSRDCSTDVRGLLSAAA